MSKTTQAAQRSATAMFFSVADKQRAAEIIDAAFPDVATACRFLAALDTQQISDPTLSTRFDIPHSVILAARASLAKIDGGK